MAAAPKDDSKSSTLKSTSRKKKPTSSSFQKNKSQTIVHFVSDLYLDQHSSDYSQSPLVEFKHHQRNRILVVAGNASKLKTNHLSEFLDYVSSRFRAIIIIIGNYEYHGYTIKEAEDRFGQIVEKYKNVYWLNRSSVVIKDIEFLGCTLWSHPKKQVRVNDFEEIKDFNRNKCIDFHRRDKNWLQRKLITPTDGERIVVTSHLPTYKALPVDKVKDKVSSCYASNSDSLLSKTDIWIAGQSYLPIHLDIPVGVLNICKDACTPLLVNPYGYIKEREATSFDNEARIIFDGFDTEIKFSGKDIRHTST